MYYWGLHANEIVKHASRFGQFKLRRCAPISNMIPQAASHDRMMLTLLPQMHRKTMPKVVPARELLPQKQSSQLYRPSEHISSLQDH